MNNVNPSILNIAGRTTNELYTVNVPSNLLNFCKFDFTFFMEESSRLCRECMKSGEYPDQEISGLKNVINNCHKYFENNLRGIFDKIVVDSWIEYICRQGEIGTTALWNTFADCKNPFRRAVFQRLSEYRSHRAINQWVNLLKMQEYARKKLDFVFGCKLNNVNEAMGRLNLFDLMFSVAANEQGYSLDAIGSVRVFKGGRLPNAPFVFGGASKEVANGLFKEVHFADKLPYVNRHESVMSDWEAMDSFAVIKGHLPEYNDIVANTIMKSMVKLPETVYLPSSFKAMIDLEIDTLLNGGAFLQRCKKCKEFYIRDDYYNSEYCDTVHRDGTTCRESMESHPIVLEPLTPEQLAFIRETSEAVYKEMSARLGMGLSQRDFSEWLSNFNVIRNKILGGEADISIFEEFVRYTREYALPQKIEEEEEEEKPEPEPEELTEDNRVVKPYQFTKMDRNELVQQGLLKKEKEYSGESAVAVAAAAASAAAPSTPPVAKIIRGAHPTSYHEIPVGNESKHEPAPQSFKAEVFTSAETAGEAARAAIQALSTEDTSKKQVKEEESKMRLPELEEFTEPAPVIRERKAPKVRLPDFGLQQEETKATETGRQEEVKLPDFGKQEGIKLPDFGRQEEVKLPDFGRQEEVKLPDFGRQEGEKLPDFSDKEKVVVPDFGEKKKSGLPDFIVNDFDDDDEEEVAAEEKEVEEKEAEKKATEENKPDFVNLNERIERLESAPKMNRAARVVNAYKSVGSVIPEPQPQKPVNEDETAARVMDDFAKILGNIERNDGFDEEDLPLDPNGIPLSHKTKHVMDAIMKNTRVSPSLVYGRRQAAEQNIVIDEAYIKSDED